MRFYDPEFGTILIDGVDIHKYNLMDLRKKMGLVMQEPTLFNYSIKENILYGKLDASNGEITAACDVANALGFITNDNLQEAFDDQADSLLEAMKREVYKAQLITKFGTAAIEQKVKDGEEKYVQMEEHVKTAEIETLGQEEYDKKIKILEDLVVKDEANGKFMALTNLLDTRDPETVGEQLHHGFEISAGNRGNKLSGGQK
jgi:ABC-type Fe3+/spermidine/putrescine transport system ATPase subunit